MALFDWQALAESLADLGLSDWAKPLRELCSQRTSLEQHGTLREWTEAWHVLPSHGQLSVDEAGGQVSVSGAALDHQSLRETLMRFHPWRKGPFNFFGLEIDTEWRSDLKWNRLVQHVDFRGKRVLDVGCGNGYYGWRMLSRGAAYVLGCDPTLLYVSQFEIFRRYVQQHQHFVAPITDTELGADLRFFDLAFSMGVLYHRTSPIDHLQKLASCLRPGGELLLETLIIEDNEPRVLVPEGRYAKMRNVWFLPSLSMLETWLRRSGFREVEVVNITRITNREQRRTSWMSFESLDDFLDPSDSYRTVEGYPGPVRAIVKCVVR